MVVICKSGEDVVTGSIKVDARDVCVCLGRQKLWFLGQKNVWLFMYGRRSFEKGLFTPTAPCY